MDFAATVEVDAPAEAPWRAVADVEQWPTWTRSMQEVSPGVTTTGTHLVRPLGSGRAQLTVGISQSGPMAPLVGLLTGRRTGRYIRLEADGLKRCAESAGR